MNNKAIQNCIDIAYSLKGKHQTGRSFHVTFGFNKTKMIVIGINDYKDTHPVHIFGVYKPIKNNNIGYKPCLHSEIDAIIKLGIRDCSKIDFLNLRIDNNGNLNMAKPCINCWNIINEQIGYRRFYYSNENGEVVRMVN